VGLIFGSYFHTAESNVLSIDLELLMGRGTANVVHDLFFSSVVFHNGCRFNDSIVVGLSSLVTILLRSGSQLNLVLKETVESIVRFITTKRAMVHFSTRSRANSFVTTFEIGGISTLSRVWGNCLTKSRLLTVAHVRLALGGFILLTMLHVVKTALSNRLLGSL
jgi:hypothetical protein